MKNKHLEKAQSLFGYSKDSTLRSDWANNYEKCLKYYEGDQWQDKSLVEEMKMIGAKPYTFNQIERITNLYTSLQIRSGKRPSVSIKDSLKNEEVITRDVKELLHKIHTDSNYTYESSKKFTDMLIGGIGWSNYGVCENAPSKIKYERIDPFEMYFDPDDLSLKLDNSSFVARTHFLPKHILLKRFPRFKDYFNDLIPDDIKNSDAFESNMRSQIDLDIWNKGRMGRIVEVQHKETEKGYKITLTSRMRDILEDWEKRIVYVFKSDIDNLDEYLEQNYADMPFDISYEEVDVNRIYQTIYSGDNLLEHKPLENQTANQSSFSYSPIIMRKDELGLPYGVVNTFISLQDSRNYLWSELLHYCDAKTLIVNLQAAPQADRATAEKVIRKELSKKRGVVTTNTGGDYNVIKHNEELQARLNLLEVNDKEFENLSGLYNTELSGTEDKNMSGVAINLRGINTMNAQNHILLAYDNMMILEGMSVLNIFKSNDIGNINIKYKHENKKRNVQFDLEYKTLSYDVYVDTVSNFNNTAEEDRTRFESLLQSPTGQLVLSSPYFLQIAGYDSNKAQEIAEEYLRITMGQEGSPEEENLIEGADNPMPENME